MTLGRLLVVLMATQQAVVYGAIANDNKENDNIKLLLQVDDKTVSTATNNDSPHHHHIKHRISLDNSDQLLDDGTQLATATKMSSINEQQDTQQDNNKPMPIIKGSVSGKKHQLQQQSSLFSIIANTNSRILLPEEEGEDPQQLLVSRGGKRLLKKKRIRAQIRNNSWGRGNNSGGRGGKGRKSSKGWVGK